MTLNKELQMIINDNIELLLLNSTVTSKVLKKVMCSIATQSYNIGVRDIKMDFLLSVSQSANDKII